MYSDADGGNDHGTVLKQTHWATEGVKDLQRGEPEAGGEMKMNLNYDGIYRIRGTNRRCTPLARMTSKKLRETEDAILVERSTA